MAELIFKDIRTRIARKDFNWVSKEISKEICEGFHKEHIEGNPEGVPKSFSWGILEETPGRFFKTISNGFFEEILKQLGTEDFFSWKKTSWVFTSK